MKTKQEEVQKKPSERTFECLTVEKLEEAAKNAFADGPTLGPGPILITSSKGVQKYHLEKLVELGLVYVLDGK